ncbi:MAG: hypothetical protein ABR905_20140 [Terracidiphilus sp.]|jgi:CHASE3 domain sensor protein
MKLSPSTLLLRGVLPVAVIMLLAFPSNLKAETDSQEHLVSSQALEQQVEQSSAIRQQNIKAVTDFLSTPTAEKVMQDSRVDPIQIRTAIPTLSDQELANLSARATDAQQKMAAGGLGIGLLTLIILAIVVIIVVAIVH